MIGRLVVQEPLRPLFAWQVPELFAVDRVTPASLVARRVHPDGTVASAYREVVIDRRTMRSRDDYARWRWLGRAVAVSGGYLDAADLAELRGSA